MAKKIDNTDFTKDPRWRAYLEGLPENSLSSLVNLETGQGVEVRKSGSEPPAVKKLSDESLVEE